MTLYKISKTKDSEPLERFYSLENAKATHNVKYGGLNIAPRYRLYKWSKTNNRWEAV